MTKIPLKNVVWKEGKAYVAWNINTSVSSFGDTRKEALESLQEALELHLEGVQLSRVQRVERPVIESLSFQHA